MLFFIALIFDYIEIVLLSDSPVIGFDVEAVSIIENMLFSRFDQYERIYYAESEHITEMSLQMYVKESNWTDDYKENVTEFEILAQMHEILKNKEQKAKKSKLYRLADIILNKQKEDLFIKRFNDAKQYEHFMQRLYMITQREDIVTTDQKN